MEIIETYWNVNKAIRDLALPFVDRNNRNILECKSFFATSFIAFFGVEIIETYWNVNIRLLFLFAGNLTEIIETYWNVN